MVYPDFLASTGYGTGDGLGGWNCRHHFYPYVEGVNRPAYTAEQLETIDQPPFEFEGKRYTQYEASQEQRRIERTIRKLQRRERAGKACGTEEGAADAAAARGKRLELQKAYERFSDVANLPIQRERMRVHYD